MKPTQKPSLISLPPNTEQAWGTLTAIWVGLRRQKLPLYLFLGLSFNVLLAPLVYAATGDLSRSQAWSLGALGLATTALSVYLFSVMIAPERF